MSKSKKSSNQAPADPSAAAVVADPSEVAKNRILEVLRERGRTNVYQIACAAGLGEDTVRPILMHELAEMVGVVQSNKDEDDDDSDGHHQEVYLRLTTNESTRLSALEQDVDSGQRKCASALREIHQSRLYREFGDFETYCERRWHHSRQWGYEQMRWLEVMEALEAAGMKNCRLGIGDANELYHLRENPTEYVAALKDAEQQATDEGGQRTREHLRKAVDARKGFVQLANQFPDLTREEFQALQSLPQSNRTYCRSFTSVQDCIKANEIPVDSSLLKSHRGQTLLDLVGQLKPVAAAIAELKALEAEQQSVDEDARAERKTIHERMVAVKRALEAPTSPGQETISPSQTANEPHGGAIVGAYDLACDGECFGNYKLPPPGTLIMEDVTDYLGDLDRAVSRGEIYGDWSVLITQHKFEEDKSQEDEADKSNNGMPKDGK
jgi:hypothetical protein